MLQLLCFPSKKRSRGKPKVWKRMAREVMEDKGYEMDMEMNLADNNSTRTYYNREMVGKSDDSAMKQTIQAEL